MRACKSWAVAALFCASSLVGGRPAAAQFIFEAGLEGELWQVLSPLGQRLTTDCITYVPWHPVFPPYPDVSTLTCSNEELAAILDQFVQPTDLATVQTGTVQDPITLEDVPIFRLYVLDQVFGRVLTFQSGLDGAWTVEPLPDADWNFSDAFNPTLSYPDSLALDAENNVLISDWGHSRIMAYTRDGVFITAIPQPGRDVLGLALSPGAVFGEPGGYIAMTAPDPDEAGAFDQIYILDTATGNTIWQFGVFGDQLGQFNGPSAVVFDAQGRLIVSDYGNSRIQVFALNTVSNNWELVAHFGEGVLQQPYSLSLDNSGRLLVSDTDNQRLIVYRPAFDNGTAEFLFELNADGGLNGFPRGVTQDPHGRLLVADFANHEIKIFQTPDLAVYDLELVDDGGGAINTLRAGTRAHLQFSVTVPYDHQQVSQVTPSCVSSDTQLASLLSGPTALPGTPSGIPLGSLLPGTAVRYSCEFDVKKKGTVDLTVGASATSVVAPARTITKVIACATCETDPPTISPAVVDPDSGNPAVLVNGWYNEDVVVRLTAVDTGAGVNRVFYRIIAGVHSGPLVTVTAPNNSSQFSVDVPVTANGRTSLIFWAEDENGTTSVINPLCHPNELPTCIPDLELFLDSEDPSLIFDFSGQSRNAAGWFKQAVSVPYTLTDVFSGLDTVTGPVSPLQFSEGAGQSVQIIAQDIAGNVTTASTLDPAHGGVGPINVDFTVPSIAADIPAGTYQGGITVQLISSDNLSGVDLVRYALAGAVSTGGQQNYTGAFTIATPGVTNLEYWAMDVAGNTTATFRVRYEINTAPVAHPFTGATNEGVTLNGTLTASDPDQSTGLVFELVTGPAIGAVQLNANGAFAYTPPAIVAVDTVVTFTFRVRDTPGAVSAPATATITVRSGNHVPVANAFSGATDEGVALNGVLTATDPDGPTTFTFALVSGPAVGQVQVNTNGTFTYTPPADVVANTPVTFTFRAFDSLGAASAPANATITVLPVNDVPTANAFSGTTSQGVVLTGQLTGTDVEDTGGLFFQLASPATLGSVIVNVNGSFVYTPPASVAANTTATFTFTVRDSGGATSAPATATITILSNRPPECSSAVASPGEIWPPNHQKTYYIGVNGVTDPDGGPITIAFTSIRQDEPTNTQGDGDTPQDGNIETNGTKAWIRAERMGRGNGRVYFLGFTATDDQGATCIGTVTVGVPHDQGRGPAIDGGARHNSMTGALIP